MRPRTANLPGRRPQEVRFNPRKALIVRRPSTTMTARMREEDRLTDAQRRMDKVSRASQLLEAKIMNLEKTVLDVREKIIEEKRKRKHMGGVKACGIHDQSVQKETQLLETRVDATKVRMSQIDAQCKALKREINALRKEKMTFREGHARLVAKFNLKKQRMAELIRKANETNESRNIALQTIDEQIAAEVAAKESFALEWTQLGAQIEEHVQLSNYLQTTAIKRKQKTIAAAIERGNLDPEEEARLRIKLTKLNSSVQNQISAIHKTQKSIQSYGEAFAKLHDHTGLTDVNEIVDRFVDCEDENFSLFNYVQVLNRESDEVERKIDALQLETEKYIEEQGQQQGNREQVLMDMKRKISRIQQMHVDAQKKNEATQATFATVVKKTSRLFALLGCEPVRRLSLDSVDSARDLPVEVTEKNIMPHLGLVEQRAHEMVLQLRQSLKAAEKGSEAEEETGPGMGNDLPPKGSSGLSIDPPDCRLDKGEIEFELNEDDGPVRPVSSSDLRKVPPEVAGIKAQRAKEKRMTLPRTFLTS